VVQRYQEPAVIKIYTEVRSDKSGHVSFVSYLEPAEESAYNASEMHGAMIIFAIVDQIRTLLYSEQKQLIERRAQEIFKRGPINLEEP
jgi:hypothetical protein